MMVQQRDVKIDPALTVLAGHGGNARELILYYVAKTAEAVQEDRPFADGFRRVFFSVADIPADDLKKFTDKLATEPFAYSILQRLCQHRDSIVGVHDAGHFVDLFLGKFP